MGAYSERDFGANGFYASEAFEDQYEEVHTGLVGLSYNRLLPNYVKLKAKAYWRHNEDEYIFVRDNPSIYRNKHIGDNIGVEGHLTIPTQNGLTGMGMELSQYFLRSNNLGNHKRAQASLYLDHRFVLFGVAGWT